jgi:hypothetical protein
MARKECGVRRYPTDANWSDVFAGHRCRKPPRWPFSHVLWSVRLSGDTGNRGLVSS